MYCQQRRHLRYIMVAKFWNTTVFVPLHRRFYLRGGLRCNPIQKEHSLYIAERTCKTVYVIWDIRGNQFTKFEPQFFSDK
jgi:hypothetical protein